jgi:SAM-dependent methyltransferase
MNFVNENKVVCPVCKVQTYVIWQENGSVAKACPQCDMVFSRGSGTQFDFDDKYYQYMLTVNKQREQHFRRLLFMIPYQLESPILDIGAGLGHFYRALPQNLAADTTLIEVSDFARKHIRQSLKAEVFASIADIPLCDKHFKTATFWDVLAHVEDPLKMLTETRERMQDGGLLVVKTPYHPTRLFKVAALLSFTLKSKSLLHIPSMRTHFIPSNLQGLLSMAGFSKISWQWAPELALSRKRWVSKSGILRVVRRIVIKQLSFIMIAKAV